MSKTDKERSPAAIPNSERPTPTSDHANPIIPASSSRPNRVLIVGDLAGFQAEVPAPATVRLFASEETEHGQMITWIKAKIDLMGFNEAGELVWLNWFALFQQSPYNREFIHPEYASMYNQLPAMRNAIREYLTHCGYTVKEGIYALDKNLKAIKGTFECVTWVKEGDTWRLAGNEEAGDAD